MGRDTGLADRIRAKGVRVVEVDGWRTRGSTTYTPRLALMHHTAGSERGAVPSLAICIFGRSDLAGPLCQVLQSREPIGDDVAYVIAAGRANHAGVGVWRGISGNSNAGGVEVEHTGTGGASPRRREITCRILAALLEGGSGDARNACQHFEFATPKGRKVDFRDLAPDTPDSIRARVDFWIGRTEEDDMPLTDDDLNKVRAIVKAEITAARQGYGETAAQLTHQNLNLALDPKSGSGSVFRKALMEMTERGVTESLREGHDLDVRLDALAPAEPPAAP